MDNQYKARVTYGEQNHLLRIDITEKVAIAGNKYETNIIYTYFNNYPEKKDNDEKDWWIFDFQSLDSNILTFDIENKSYINTKKKKENVCKLITFQSIFLDEARKRLLKES